MVEQGISRIANSKDTYWVRYLKVDDAVHPMAFSLVWKSEKTPMRSVALSIILCQDEVLIWEKPAIKKGQLLTEDEILEFSSQLLETI